MRIKSNIKTDYISFIGDYLVFKKACKDYNLTDFETLKLFNILIEGGLKE